MKNMLCVLGIIFALTTQTYALEEKKEAQLFHAAIGTTYLDYIVTDITPDISNAQLEFGIGDLGSFLSSTYFYFYQLENHLDTESLETFNVYLAETSIKSAGYFVNELLDSSVFMHDLGSAEHEMSGGVLKDPLSIDFYPGDPLYGFADMLTWSFFGNNALFPADQSTVLFITSDLPPADTDVDALSIDFLLAGKASAPSTVPEPTAMILFGLGSAMLVKSVRKK